MGGILHRKQPLATGAGAFAQKRGGSAAAAAASAAAAAVRHGVSVQAPGYCTLYTGAADFGTVCVLCSLGALG